MTLDYVGGFVPTPSQREAMEYTDGSLVVAAGAGSGKTRVLVERFVNLLRLGKASVDEIVAITFTRKAALEMKSRVRTTLREMAESDSKRRNRWLEEAEALGRAQISTIHSFCTHLIRRFPVEAGVDPEFTTVEGHYGRLILDEACEDVLVRYLEENPDSPVWKHFSFGDLKSALLELYSAMRNAGTSPGDVELLMGDANASLQMELNARIALVRLAEVEIRRIALEETLPKNSRRRVDSLMARWPSVTDALTRLKQEPCLQDALLLEEAADTLKGSVPHCLTDVKQSLRTAVQDIKLLAADLAAGPLRREITRLMALMHDSFTAVKRENGLLDYEDLQVYARNLLGEDEIRDWCQNRYRYVMVDEYQDTNGLQMEIIRLVVGDDPSNRLFVVGDPKQSIYRFRGADVEVFARTTRLVEGMPGGKRVFLDTNFRSQKAVQDFANFLFSRLMPKGTSDYEVPYEACRAVRTEAKGYAVEWLRIPGGGNREEVREREADALAKRLAHMVWTDFALPGLGRSVKYGDIAILMRAMSNLAIYTRALEKAGVPYNVVAGKGFYFRQEVMDVVNFLHALDNRHNELAFVGILRSPFCGVHDGTIMTLKGKGPIWQVLQKGDFAGVAPEEEEKLKAFWSDFVRLRELRGRVCLADLLEEIVLGTGYMDLSEILPDGTKRVLNLEKLLLVGRKFEEASVYGLGDFVEFVRQAGLSEEEGEADDRREGDDSVTILTVHKSKGLEFPVVVVPDLSRGVNADSGRVNFSPARGLGVKLRDQGKVLSSFTWQTVNDEERSKSMAEEKRMFYVACTRAREYLLLVGADDRPKEDRTIDDLSNWSQWLSQIVDPMRGIGDSYCGTLALEGAALFVSNPSVYDDIPAPVNQGPRDTGQFRKSAECFVRPKAMELTRSYSVTELTVLGRCPRRYYYQYKCRIPEPSVRKWRRRDGNEGRESSILTPLAVGNVVHRVCERLLRKEDMRDVLEWSLQMEGVSRSDIPKAREEVEDIVTAYTESEFFSSLPARGEVRSEVPFAFALGSGRVTGTIDRLYFNSSGVEVVDFKTNAITKEEVDWAVDEYEIQLQLYSYAVERLTGQAVTKATVYFLRPDIAVEIIPKPNMVEDWLQTAFRVSQGKRPQEFRQNFRACSQCWYYPLCWKGVGPSLDEGFTG